MPTESAADAVFSLLGTATLSANKRLLRVDTPLSSTLALEKMTLSEGVSRLFRMTLDCLATSTELDVASLLGKEISAHLLLSDGSTRTWHGTVQSCDALGADGGLARYRLVAGPWLAALALRRDSFIFQDKGALDILSEIFADYPDAAFDFHVSEAPKPRPIRTQYRESDLDFVLRLLAEEGLAYRFEHAQGDDDDNQQKSASRHRLVVFDDDAERAVNAASPIRFHRSDATESLDAIERFSALRQLQANAVARSAWDDRALQAHAAQTSATQRIGALPVLEDHDAGGHGRYADAAMAERRAQTRLHAFEARQLRFEGAGTVRQLAPGENFVLSQHSRFGAASQDASQDANQKQAADLGDNRYSILSIVHEAANNLGAQAARLLATHDLEQGTYRNRFIAQAQTASFAPVWMPKPTAPESMCAIVVTAEGSPLTTGRDLRIKVQFPWQRGAAPVAGGLAHASAADAQGNAPGNEKSGTWLRVAKSSAGSNWGSHALARTGTEVIVAFLDGDIDQPLIAGQLYNDSDLPPWSAGADAQANHPGVLSGWHSQSLSGDSYSQWVFDDAAKQLRTRLASSTANSQLNLGYVIDQKAGSSDRGPWRGSGFELRSDAWTTIRSGDGLLLSASAQQDAKGSAADVGEPLALLRGAQASAKRIGDAATQAGAPAMAANAGFDPLIKALDPEADGKYAGTVNGQQAAKASGDGRTGSEPVDRINGAYVVIDSPTAINLASPATIALYAGAHIHATSQQDTHLAARQTFSAVAGKSIGLFTQAGGFTAVAAQAPLSVRAHNDALEMLAAQDVKITSSTEGIDILAKQSISFTAAGGQVTLQGGDVLFHCAGNFSVKGTSHNFVGPASDPAALPNLPREQVNVPPMPKQMVSSYDEQIVYQDGNSAPFHELPFHVDHKPPEEQLLGGTPTKGEVKRVYTKTPEPLEYSLRYAPFKIDT